LVDVNTVVLVLKEWHVHDNSLLVILNYS
jgi:hypothetical protein